MGVRRASKGARVRVLLVEDEEASVRRFFDSLEQQDFAPRVEVTTARCFESACEIIDAVDFDLVICDLHIPRDAEGEPELDHGIAVYEHVTSTQPGAPTVLVTGSGDERRARQLVAARHPADLFGVNETYPMADFVFKEEMDDLMQRISDIALQLDTLDAIELQTGSSEEWPSALQSRALRIFARRNNAQRVEISALGGLSEAAALRAALYQAGPDGNSEDAPLASVFAKLGPLERLEDESRRYHEAALRLPAGAYAPLLDTVDAGAGRVGGLFYGLAEQHQASLFEWIATHPDDAAETVGRLREVLGEWRGQDGDDEELVTTLRRDRLSSNDLKEYAPALGDECWAFEKERIPVRRSLQHGDLHGENVLVADSGAPLLIDFANVEARPSAFDPVVLELSLVFQDNSPFLRGTWPTPEQCERWADLDAYLEGCPAPGLVRACREWAMDAAEAPVAVYAVAYAEALRQIAYSKRDPACAVGIARSAALEGMRALGRSDGDEEMGRDARS